MDKLIQKAATLMEAMPYMQEFRDAIIVVKFGGSAMEDPALTESVLRDVVLMECIGMRPVIVHGGGKAISAKLESLGIPVKKTGGMRHTCEATIKIVDEVLHDDVNANLITLLEKHRGPARALSGKNILKAQKMYVEDQGQKVDVGFVGEVADVDTLQILDILNNGEIPVITPVGKDSDGNAYNINADVAAAKVAEALKARKIVFLSDVPGLLKDPSDENTLIRSLKLNEIDALMEDGTISGGMLPKIISAVDALKAGTRKVHMVDGRKQHSLLLEIFTDSGVGTEIVH